ncbi:MAG: SPW repeat protein [Thiohalomonadaceae bacterium]
MRKGLWQDWVNLVLGVWLFVAPFFGIGATSEAAVWNSYLAGIAIVVFAWASLAKPQRWKEWINLIIGVWLIISPFALGYTALQGAMWNHIIVGLLVGADALWAMNSPVLTRRHA